LHIPLALLAEQRRIVAKIEALFAQADAVERAVEVARRRAEKVDQAMIFDGHAAPGRPTGGAWPVATPQPVATSP
jgi:hypothetical protein